MLQPTSLMMSRFWRAAAFQFVPKRSTGHVVVAGIGGLNIIPVVARAELRESMMT